MTNEEIEREARATVAKYFSGPVPIYNNCVGAVAELCCSLVSQAYEEAARFFCEHCAIGTQPHLAEGAYVHTVGRPCEVTAGGHGVRVSTGDEACRAAPLYHLRDSLVLEPAS